MVNNISDKYSNGRDAYKVFLLHPNIQYILVDEFIAERCDILELILR